jgi:hypothetical protein
VHVQKVLTNFIGLKKNIHLVTKSLYYLTDIQYMYKYFQCRTPLLVLILVRILYTVVCTLIFTPCFLPFLGRRGSNQSVYRCNICVIIWIVGFCRLK